jgi:hypothetical protein
MAQVGQQAVGDVDGGMGQAAQGEPQFHPRLGALQGGHEVFPERLGQARAALQVG